MKIELNIFEKPIGKQRPRVVNRHAYTPKKTVDFEQLIQRNFKIKYPNFTPFMTNLKMRIIAKFQIPKSYSNKKRNSLLGKYYPHKPDVDNIAKIVQDALNGLAYKDDMQICSLSLEKYYCNENEREYLHIEIEECNADNS